ncbi:uncharacterized protein LOC132695820 [Cylas formicarius]|uniref:uncharacterized protein LOC132695820 n=1 Tax=Cylas formicarius TaxID=197179 RepID=UPI00295885DD|nr:uncharacterized protein LOC132695820 [Cylas formicarius]
MASNAEPRTGEEEMDLEVTNEDNEDSWILDYLIRIFLFFFNPMTNEVLGLKINAWVSMFLPVLAIVTYIQINAMNQLAQICSYYYWRIRNLEEANSDLLGMLDIFRDNYPDIYAELFPESA